MLRVLHSRWFGFAMGILCTLALVIALGSVTGAWAGPLGQDTQQPDGPTSPDATVSRIIPIQGRLTDASGNPIDGTRSITFTLYTTPSGNTVVCQDNDTVIVTNGLFDSAIDFCTAADINGQALYLGIWVHGESAEMTPRQTIFPVPYAFSLVPGAQIGGTGAGDGSLNLANAAGTQTLRLESATGRIYFGGSGQAGDVIVRNSSSVSTFQANGSTGNVIQARTADGLVKAAVFAVCGNSGSAITRSFNNVAGRISVINGTSAGECTIDFGFDVSDRFVVVTAAGAGVARYVTYAFQANNNSLNFYKWSDAGSGVNGAIMVLIY